MARKKKLNKRVVVFLVIVTVIVLAGAVVFVAPKMPQDPEALAARARAAANAKNYRVAEAAWGRAIRADPLAQYYCEAADLQIEIAGLPETPQADRVERLHRAHQMLQRAVLGDPGHVEAQRMLADFYEPGAGERYLKEADRLLALVPDDHETYFKCAVVKADLAGSLPGEYTDPAKRGNFSLKTLSTGTAWRHSTAGSNDTTRPGTPMSRPLRLCPMIRRSGCHMPHISNSEVTLLQPASKSRRPSKGPPTVP